MYEIAKDLSDKDSLMMLAAGAKSNEPLVFQDGGKSYRGFLEGRVKEGSYVLLLHITNYTPCCPHYKQGSSFILYILICNLYNLTNWKENDEGYMCDAVIDT